GDLEHHSVHRPGFVLALLDVEAQNPFGLSASVAFEGLLAGEVVARLGEAAPPAVQQSRMRRVDRAAESHLDARRDDQRAVAEYAGAHGPSSRLSCGGSSASGAGSGGPAGTIAGSASSRICAEASWLQSRWRAGQSKQRARCGCSVTSKPPPRSLASSASIRAPAATRSSLPNAVLTGRSGTSRKT